MKLGWAWLQFVRLGMNGSGLAEFGTVGLNWKELDSPVVHRVGLFDWAKLSSARPSWAQLDWTKLSSAFQDGLGWAELVKYLCYAGMGLNQLNYAWLG